MTKINQYDKYTLNWEANASNVIQRFAFSYLHNYCVYFIMCVARNKAREDIKNMKVHTLSLTYFIYRSGSVPTIAPRQPIPD